MFNLKNYKLIAEGSKEKVVDQTQQDSSKSMSSYKTTHIENSTVSLNFRHFPTTLKSIKKNDCSFEVVPVPQLPNITSQNLN